MRAAWLGVQAKDVAVIPRFFFPGGPPVPEAVQRSMQAKLDSCFAAHPDGLTIPAVKDLMREVGCCCRLCVACRRMRTPGILAFGAGMHRAEHC
jgi:hypothetical protein